jgi:hypothetical protein
MVNTSKAFTFQICVNRKENFLRFLEFCVLGEICISLQRRVFCDIMLYLADEAGKISENLKLLI